MTIPNWPPVVGPDQLDSFVAAVDGAGGPSAAVLAQPFRYAPSVMPDVTLNPLSEEYSAQMLALYAEIAGRTLNQNSGELTSFDMEHHLGGANPYAERDTGFIARHARTVMTVMMAANLPRAPRVLDLGCGWGLSTEMIAFTGAEVTAIDINPRFVELVRRRAARQSRSQHVVCSNFDNLNLDSLYDFALFYECFHHAVQPWKTLRTLDRFMKHDARIAIAGEPINDIWWPHWGLRLDAMSIYCIRKFGWFESGWSAAFITRVFAECGWTLTLVPGLGLDDGMIGFAQRADVVIDRPLILPAARFFAPPPPAPAP